MTWLLLECEGGEVHVVPDDDLKPHRQHECWCFACAAVDDDMVIVHNSMDQRERHEAGAPLH